MSFVSLDLSWLELNGELNTLINDSNYLSYLKLVQSENLLNFLIIASDFIFYINFYANCRLCANCFSILIKVINIFLLLEIN